MNWIGLTDHAEGRFSPTGLGAVKAPPPGELMNRGTLMFETRVVGNVRPHDLLSQSHVFPFKRVLAFRAVPGDGITIEIGRAHV